MARKPGGSPPTQNRRPPTPVKQVVVTAPAKQARPDAPRKRVSPAQFFNEVRAEARKVTWTSWKETWITSVMVGIMVVMASAFFFGVDAAFGFGMQQILKLANLGQ